MGQSLLDIKSAVTHQFHIEENVSQHLILCNKHSQISAKNVKLCDISKLMKSRRLEIDDILSKHDNRLLEKSVLAVHERHLSNKHFNDNILKTISKKNLSVKLRGL